MPADLVQQYQAFLLVGCNYNVQYCWCDVIDTHDCWPRVSLTDMCAGSVPHNYIRVIVRMSDDLVAIHGCCSIFNMPSDRIGTIQSDMPPGPLKINEKSYSTDAPPSDMPTYNVKLYQTRLLHCQYNILVCWSCVKSLRELLCRCSCNIYACWPCVTATNTAVVQTCLLVECCCKMDACWTVATQSSCLPIFCISILLFSICHTCWYGVSLSAMPAGVVTHYRTRLLMRCLTISRACWCGASL